MKICVKQIFYLELVETNKQKYYRQVAQFILIHSSEDLYLGFKIVIANQPQNANGLLTT